MVVGCGRPRRHRRASAIAYADRRHPLPAPRWRVACFVGGCALLLAVQIGAARHARAPPICCSMHLLQNVVLAEWGPLLCVLGLTPGDGRPARADPGRPRSPPTRSSRSGLARHLLRLAPALGLRRRARPPVDDPPRSSTRAYFAAGFLVWWPVVHGRLGNGRQGALPVRRVRARQPARSAARAPADPVYDFYEQAPRLWGLSTLTDQQIAGVTMASEQAVVFFVVLAIFLRRFFEEEGRGRRACPAVPDSARSLSRRAAEHARSAGAALGALLQRRAPAATAPRRSSSQPERRARRPPTGSRLTSPALSARVTSSVTVLCVSCMRSASSVTVDRPWRHLIISRSR